MAVPVSALITRIQDQLMDDTGVRWTEEELIRYVSDGQREITNFKPDAISTIADVGVPADSSSHGLVPGTKQTLPANALRLLSIVRNTYSGATRSVRAVSRETLDRFVPDWHSTAAGKTNQEVKHYTYDPDSPTIFYIYPPQPNPVTGQIEVIYTKTPDDISDSTANIEVDDSYANALIDYALYRALSKDADNQGAAQRAQNHYGAFMGSLNNKGRADGISSPQVQPFTQASAVKNN